MTFKSDLVTFFTNFEAMHGMDHKMKSQTWFKISIISLAIVTWTNVRATDPTPPDSIPAHHNNPLLKLQVSHEIDTTTGAVDTTYRFVVEAHHRVFTNFQQTDTVFLHQKFPVGEGDEIAEVFVFNPDLMITDKGEYLKLSDSLLNPAVRVRVWKKDSVIQQSWAFLYADAPHFRRNDILGFKLVSCEVPDKFIKVAGPAWMTETAADSTARKPK